MMIFLDFDGTMVEHRYPDMGAENPGAFNVIIKLQKAGHRVVLNTYRADCGDGTLELAIQYLNEHPVHRITPITRWCAKKVSPAPWNIPAFQQTGEMFIDDIALGMPMMTNENGAPVVDWKEVDRQLTAHGLYKPVQ